MLPLPDLRKLPDGALRPLKIDSGGRMMQQIPMSEVKQRYGEGHWFDPETMKFFGTRLPKYAYEGPGGTYFVTSEKPPYGPRAYSVRQLVGPSKIETIGPFCESSRDEAVKLANRCASGDA